MGVITMHKEILLSSVSCKIYLNIQFYMVIDIDYFTLITANIIIIESEVQNVHHYNFLSKH